MKEQIVSFEVAKLAKEKGFNIPCRSKYTVMKTKKKFTTNSMLSRVSTKDNVYLVPTQSLLQKWLREGRSINVIVDKVDSTPSSGYYFNIYSENIEDEYDIIEFDTYEEALEKGLEEALKIIDNETIKSKS